MLIISVVAKKEENQVAQPEPAMVASVSESKPGSIASTTTAAPPPPPPPAAAPQPQKRTDGRVIATPYAKKLAKELGLDLNSLAGSGPAGRITAQDVESYKSNGGETQFKGTGRRILNISFPTNVCLKEIMQRVRT